MHWSDRFIASSSSWSNFWERAKKLPTDSEKGAAFERLTQLYLQTTPEYQTELRHVWTLDEVPPAVRRRLDLPFRDEGIDLIACTRHGQYWAIQSKFRSQRDKPLNRKELGTFASLAFNTCSNIALAVVAHTASKPVSKRHLMRNTTEIGLDRWQSLDKVAWRLIVGKLRGRSARPDARRPRPHQRAAISAAKAHFVRDGAARGRLIMPCGTGKSLTAYWIAEALKAKTILVAVPSLALVRQSLTDWTREFLAHAIKPDWLCVCSDETVGDLEVDKFVGEVYDLEFCNSGHKPADIPAAPWGTYADAGWSGMGDWIGTGRRRGRGWRNFKDARAFVRGLGLKSGAEWRAYCQSGKKPDDIPAYPNDTYARSGSVGYGDWLGYARKR